MVLAIAALDFFMHALLYLTLEDAGTSWLVKVGDLKNVRSIDPVVSAAAHDMIAFDIELVDWDLSRTVMSASRQGGCDMDAHIGVRRRVNAGGT